MPLRLLFVLAHLLPANLGSEERPKNRLLRKGITFYRTLSPRVVNLLMELFGRKKDAAGTERYPPGRAGALVAASCHAR